MEHDTETTAPETPTGSPRTRELVRPVAGRMFGGVAQGIANHFGLHPWLPRVLFIITTLMGGLGIALYAAGWAFIRSEDEADSPADRFFSGASTSRAWIGIGLMVVAGIIVLSNFTFLSGEVVWALAFLVVGLLLYLGYIPTGSSRRSEVEAVESKEGVQQMTTETTQREGMLTDDSPVGGSTPTPPIVTPTPTPPDLPPSKPRQPSILGRLTIGVMLLGTGVLAVLDNIDSLPIDAGPRHYLALAVTILGVGLLVGSIVGRARWLILLALFMIPTLMFSPVFDYEWSDANFDRTAVPASFAEVDTNYSIDVGTLVIDLRDLPWDGRELPITANVDVGQIRLLIPHDVGIIGEASVHVGEVSEPGRNSAGLGNPRLEWNEIGQAGTVRLDAEVNLGSIDIDR